MAIVYWNIKTGQVCTVEDIVVRQSGSRAGCGAKGGAGIGQGQGHGCGKNDAIEKSAEELEKELETYHVEAIQVS